ncbi:MAG: ankyrin repeat domain-containing protein [Rhodocyclaceae bacterium]|nr:ankyrin repeat domain-containing protein [Rhodocyclaceae bacterium]
MVLVVVVPIALLVFSGWLAHRLQDFGDTDPPSRPAIAAVDDAPGPAAEAIGGNAAAATRRCPKLTDEVPPLVEASACGDFPRLERLLAEGTDVHQHDPRPAFRGQSALHHAVARGDADAIEALLRAGASADDIDAAGNSPLHLVALDDKLAEDIAIARQLIRAGADIARRNNAGYTVIDELRARPRLARARAELASYLDATATQLATISKARGYLDRRAPDSDELSVLELEPADGENGSIPPAPRGDEEALRALIAAWARAWSAGDPDAYFSFYGRRFAPDDGSGREQWEAQRRARIDGPERISVTISGLELEIGEAQARARFIQTYRSPNFSEEGPKTLVLSRDGGHWRIVGEHDRP